jgi:preprotein translocase subunit SecG
MFTVLILLIILISILLTVVVLSQSSKGDGLSGGLGAPGGFGAVVGVRRASDFLVRATIGLAIAFGVLTMVANLFFLPASSQVTANPLTSGAGPVPTMPQGVQQQRQSAPAAQQPAPVAQPSAPDATPNPVPAK